jgi:hypothetical protein
LQWYFKSAKKKCNQCVLIAWVSLGWPQRKKIEIVKVHLSGQNSSLHASAAVKAVGAGVRIS